MSRLVRPLIAWRGPVAALVLTVLAFGLVMQGVVAAVAMAPRSVPEGAIGDQAFYLWAIERARSSESYEAFVVNCDWSVAGCTDLRAVPQEWRAFYVVGSAARRFALDAASVVAIWYLLSTLFNAIAAAAFIGTVSRNWVLAGALAPLVAFQQSLAFRMKGHFSLVAAWPLIGAMAMLWRALEDIAEGHKSRLIVDLFGLAALLLLTAFGSHYYLLFAALLLPALTVAFVIVHRRTVSLLDLLRRPRATWLLATVAATALAFLVVQRADRPRQVHRATEIRPVSDVVACSSAWCDYVRPTDSSGAAAAFGRVGLVLRGSALDGRWPWEVNGFLGATLLIALLLTIVALFIRSLRRPVVQDGNSGEPSKLAGFAALALVAAFFGTATGGRIIHGLLPAARCFNRMAPFTVLLAGTAIAIAWRARPMASRAIAAAVLALCVLEHRDAPLLSRQMMVTLSEDLRFAARLRTVCAGQRLSVSPAVNDFMFGPYRIYYLAQLAGCRLDGIRGTAAGGVQSVVPIAPEFALRWNGGPNGFEKVYLEERAASGAVRDVDIYAGR